ncbi:MAG: methyltransferase domain-containing protein [Planctomycetota bacterium]
MDPHRRPPGAPRRLCVFQMHHTDADERLLATSAVPRVLASGLFDDVVLAVADVPENGVLDRFAAHWGIELFRGAERDVARRILDCAQAHGADIVARALVWWFFVDLDLVAGQIAALEAGGADCVNLPADFDLRFGMDVFTPRFLAEVEAALADAEVRREYELHPWSLAEAQPERFRIRTYAAVPIYGPAAFAALRERMRALWPERWDGSGASLYPYRRAAALLADQGGEALDIACGLGAGTAVLARAGRVLGVDASETAIAQCRERCGGGAEFLAGDALDLDLGGDRFGVAVSVHTMEHVADDRAFLANLARWLAPGGRLVLEVPFQMRRPFLGAPAPLSPGHVREYDARTLLHLVGDRFTVDEVFGVNRGAYLSLARARSAGLVVGTVRKGG